MPSEYYFISDLHIGGDEQLQQCAFEDELVSFLRDLESNGPETELVVLGDAFGLWEFTEVDGLAKFDALVDAYPDLFEQFRRTGEHITITFIPGNHDYELACYPEYVELLAQYNITLEQELSLTRELNGKQIWVEHGMQEDPNNSMPDFGNPYANPPGYFVNQHVTSTAGKLSDRGRYNWLKDIQSVAPMEEIPRWMISNYFYREMSPFLRYAVLPFLVLFNVSFLFLAAAVLQFLGIIPLDSFLQETIFRPLGIVGAAIEVIILVNLVVVALLFILWIPLSFFVRDLRRTFERFGFVPDVSRREEDTRYLDAAGEVFDANPDVVAFVYGHTHRASFTDVDGRYVLNTGTWLKRFKRVRAPYTPLPSVYYPSFRLNYFRMFDDDGRFIIEYDVIEKPNPKELSLLERLVTPTPAPPEPIPHRTVVETKSLEEQQLS
jgi:UDP-2,3-diacylglucosamine pyrophosphatase LpxH